MKKSVFFVFFAIFMTMGLGLSAGAAFSPDMALEYLKKAVEKHIPHGYYLEDEDYETRDVEFLKHDDDIYLLGTSTGEINGGVAYCFEFCAFRLFSRRAIVFADGAVEFDSYEDDSSYNDYLYLFPSLTQPPEASKPALFASAAYAAMSADGFLDLCGEGTLQQIETAIKEGADVNAKYPNGTTALMLAARANSNPEVINLLIKRGANVKAKDESGWTPLIWAACNNSNPGVITALIKGGADLNAKDKEGYTVFMFAARSNSNPEVINALIKNGFDVNAKDKNGWSALMLAAAFNETPGVVAALLKAGADVNVKDQDGYTPIMLAEENNANSEEIIALLKAGAGAKTTGNDGERAINEALQSVKEHIRKTDPDALGYLQISFDHETDSIYSFQAYQIVAPGGSGTGKTITYNWYEVDKNTGEIKEMF